MITPTLPAIQFAPLPDIGAGAANTRTDWWKVAAHLAQRPGEWAAVITDHRRKNAPLGTQQMRERNLEGRLRSNGDGTYTVWMRSTVPPLIAPRPPGPRDDITEKPRPAAPVGPTFADQVAAQVAHLFAGGLHWSAA